MGGPTVMVLGVCANACLGPRGLWGVVSLLLFLVEGSHVFSRGSNMQNRGRK